MSKLIVIAGMKRSGSTWMYNAVRLLLEEAGVSVYGAWVGDYDPTNEAEYHVVKAHDYDEDLEGQAQFVICTLRNPTEAIESRQRFGIPWDNETMIHDWINSYLWEREANYVSHYDEKFGTTECIFKLWVELDGIFKLAGFMKTYDKLQQLKPPIADSVDYYDPITLLHPNHITREK